MLERESEELRETVARGRAERGKAESDEMDWERERANITADDEQPGFMIVGRASCASAS